MIIIISIETPDFCDDGTKWCNIRYIEFDQALLKNYKAAKLSAQLPIKLAVVVPRATVLANRGLEDTEKVGRVGKAESDEPGRACTGFLLNC
jgi:hypothetical protein